MPADNAWLIVSTTVQSTTDCFCRWILLESAAFQKDCFTKQIKMLVSGENDKIKKKGKDSSHEGEAMHAHTQCIYMMHTTTYIDFL